METIKSTFQIYAIATIGYTIREETFEGRAYIVVPVVMMKEGVHAGNKGPILHTAEELTKFVSAWDGIPVTISHPTKNGIAVSANDPQILESSAVGQIFNTRYDDGLKAEAWIDVEKISNLSAEALTSIQEGQPLDVSIGAFTEALDTEGEWQGETYEAIASNYRPNHLALLPGETGACSWNDGCGIRVYKKGEQRMKKQFQTFKELSKQGLAVAPITNEQGFREILESLQLEVNKMDTDDSYHYIEEVFSDFIVYRKRIFDGGGETLYRQEYSIDANGNVAFSGLASEVKKKVEYVTMKMVRTTISNNKNEGGQKMSIEKTPCCEAKVDALIANKALHWTAEDREWLLSQKENAIDKMFPKEGPGVEPIQVNAEEVITTFKATLKTPADFLALMPEEMKAEVEKGIEAYKANRDALVQGIMDNAEKDVWTKEALEALSDEVLERVSKSIKKPANYSGAASPTVHAEEGEMLLPPGVGEKKEG